MTAKQKHWREFGNPRGAPIIFAHGLGVDSSVWLSAIEALESRRDCRIITYDLPGHGERTHRGGRGSMGALVRDVESLADDLDIRRAVIVGHGLGGMIAQGLAVKRLDIVRAMVLVNTSAKLGAKEQWAAQIETIRSGNHLEFIAQLWAKWIRKSDRDNPVFASWKRKLENTDPNALAAAIEAISGTDFYTPISGLGLPTLGISAYNDKMFPPDLMRETLDVIKGADFKIMPRVGHLSMVESPQEFAHLLDTFLHQIGHQDNPDV